ncbi:MAG: protein GumC [Desulfobacteraceae bacterium]|nr:protein GumC [Desulfobacteraceae bacterium]MBC2719431.1 protein GumC [Desulfobacteraceae bacterium]
MQNKSETIKLGYLVDILLRRRWFIIIPFCLSMIIGIYFALTLPKIYSSRTLILIQPQRVPTEYVRSIVSSGVEARISTISQQIMSRTNLEKIIEQFNLFSGPEYKNIFIEDKLATLRNNISVDVTKSSRNRDTDSFSITVKGKYPEKIAKIANTLTSFFIDENLRLRETQAIGTSDFLENELQIMTRRLEEREEALKLYNQKFMGGLPEQLETNLRILDRLQELLSEQKSSLKDAKNRLVEFENRIPPELQNFPLISGTNQTEYLSNIDQIKERLASLKTKYTDRHPDVIRLNKTINEFDSKMKNKSEGTEDSETSENSISYNGTYTKQRKGLKKEIKILEEDIAKLSDNIRYYEKLVEDTPKREQELLSLRRDYQNIQASYSSLLKRKLEAEISVNMEKKQKGEQFRIVDTARVPEKPISPNMKRLLLFAIAAGIAIGCGIIYLLEFLDSSFRDAKTVETFLGLSVIATVPVLNNPKIDRKHKLNNIFSILSSLLSFFLLGVLFLLTFYGVERTIEVIKNF